MQLTCCCSKLYCNGKTKQRLRAVRERFKKIEKNYPLKRISRKSSSDQANGQSSTIGRDLFNLANAHKNDNIQVNNNDNELYEDRWMRKDNSSGKKGKNIEIPSKEGNSQLEQRANFTTLKPSTPISSIRITSKNGKNIPPEIDPTTLLSFTPNQSKTQFTMSENFKSITLTRRNEVSFPSSNTTKSSTSFTKRHEKPLSTKSPEIRTSILSTSNISFTNIKIREEIKSRETTISIHSDTHILPIVSHIEDDYITKFPEEKKNGRTSFSEEKNHNASPFLKRSHLATEKNKIQFIEQNTKTEEENDVNAMKRTIPWWIITLSGFMISVIIAAIIFKIVKKR